MAITIHTLPNELILHTLSLLSTTQLLPLATLSHRFHALITRLLTSRLQSTCTDHALILEVYHPSAKLTEPPLDCAYLGTCPPLETCITETEGAVGKLAGLRGVYSVFRPRRRHSGGRRRTVIRIPGDIPGSRTHPSSATAEPEEEEEEELPKQILSLEGHELFTQLCAGTNLIRVGPRVGLFRSFVKVHEGVVRVWKDWLAERAKARSGSFGKLGNAEEFQDLGTDEHILWVDPPKNVGLRVKVTEKSWRRNMPILIHADEEVNVSYEVEYQETYVRTSHMLLMLEKSAEEQDINSGKAVVFGNFR